MTAKMKDYDFLIGPIIEDDCDHGLFISDKVQEDSIGVSRELFIKAMQAEGIAIGYGYVLPVHLQPIYQLHMQNIYSDYEGFGLESLQSSSDLSFNDSVDYEEHLPATEKMHLKKL